MWGLGDCRGVDKFSTSNVLMALQDAQLAHMGVYLDPDQVEQTLGLVIRGRAAQIQELASRIEHRKTALEDAPSRFDDDQVV